MKNGFLVLVFCIFTLSVNAQTMKVYKNGIVIEEYTQYDMDSVIVQENATAHSYVDLWLPSGTLWATCNVGADNPEDYGLYFAWGDTKGYTIDTNDGQMFDWYDYKWCNGSENSMTKYCTNSKYGTVDQKTELESDDDVATVFWGSEWRMPSKKQIEELIDTKYTTSEWTTQNGVYGRLITSISNGNSIFIPAAGLRKNGTFQNSNFGGYIWSRSLYTGNITFHEWNASNLAFYNNDIYLNCNYRYNGFPVRPVRSRR